MATIKVASFEQITGTAVLTGSADHPVVVLHMVNRKGEVYTREYALRQKTITHAVEYTVKLLASDLVKGLRPKSKKAPITPAAGRGRVCRGPTADAGADR